MDGASSLRVLRWKQICAGALSAASLIAGHLVFGQDAQTLPRQPGSAAGQSTTTAAGSLAPILNARAMPAPALRPSVTSNPTSGTLPPILDGRQLPKPRASEATFVPLQPRSEPKAANAQPVATLELTPSKTTAPVKKPSAVSPWMMDIDQALTEPGQSKPSDGPVEKDLAETKSDAPKQAYTKTALPQIVAAPSAAQAAPRASEVAAQPAQNMLPTVQLGAPTAPRTYVKSTLPGQSNVAGRSRSDLRKPIASTPPAAQLNPFARQRDSTATRDAKVASKTPNESKYGGYLLPPMEEEPKSQATGALGRNAGPTSGTSQPTDTSAESGELAAATLPAAPVPATYAHGPDSAKRHENAIPKAWSPPVITAEDSAATAKPKQNLASAAEAPIVDRAAAALPQRTTGETYHTETTVGHRATNGDRLQLTGYEPEERATFAGEAPGFGEEPSPSSENSSQSDQPPTQFRATPAQPQQPQFTQAQAPRQLHGLPAGPFEMIGESGTVSVMVRRSMLLRTAQDIYRTAVVDPNICDVIQFTPKEISIIGKSQGSTHVTFWFDGPNAQPITYLVKVEPDSAEVKKEEDKYKLLEDVVNEMFPDSKVQLMLVADKLIVKGQAKDSEEATQIMSIIRTNAAGGAGGAWGPGGWNGGAGGGLSEGVAADVLSDSATGTAARARYQVINMLRVPGVQQVALRVKIAELNRTAARGFGVDVQGNVAFSDSPEGTDLFFNSILNVAGGGAPALLAQFDGDDISIGIRYLQQQGVIRLLSEPTLVTMSGRPATFVAGGEFAVPTVVGSAGLNAVTTDFRAFGAIISFLPTVVDKDRIRLEVSPEFSQINQDLAVGGTPGLKTRAVTTTVEMREGQTFAIAGLLEDNMNGTTIGDLPFLAQIFGRRSMQRAETELIILVTPELVHPMEAEEVPPLPGFDVTEPDNAQFFLHGKIEGTPTREYRSTVWPRLKNRYKAGGPAMTSGPFGHGQ